MEHAGDLVELVKAIISDRGRTEAPGQAAVSNTQTVCKQLGITARTVRFYSDLGIATPRRRGTTRLFTPSQIRRLQLARELRSIGLEVKAVVDLLETLSQPGSMQKKLTAVSERVSNHIEDLKRREEEVRQQQDLARRLVQELAAQSAI